MNRLVVDSSAFRASLVAIGSALSGPASIKAALVAGAGVIMADARRRAPVDTGLLRNSGILENPTRSVDGHQIRFGFTQPYSRIMDTGWRVPYIYPRRARHLFIPLSAAAKAGGPRGGPYEYGTDYVLASRVKTSPPVLGRRKGPNFYFTGAVRSRAGAAIVECARQIQLTLRASLSASSRR